LEIEKGQAFKLVALQRSTSLIPKGGGSMAQHHHIGPAGTGEEATCPYCKKKILVVLSGISTVMKTGRRRPADSKSRGP
jgi:hypothetical protein